MESHLPYKSSDYTPISSCLSVGVEIKLAATNSTTTSMMESLPLTREQSEDSNSSCHEAFSCSCKKTLPLQVEVSLVCRVCRKVTEAQFHSFVSTDHLSVTTPCATDRSKRHKQDWPDQKETLQHCKTSSPKRTDCCHDCSALECTKQFSKGVIPQNSLLETQPREQRMNLYVTLESTDGVSILTSNSYEYLDTITGYQYPWGVAVSNNGDVAVAEWGGNCVTVLDSRGRLKASFGYKDKKKTCLQNPWGVQFAGDNHLLVTDSTRVLKYTIKGSLVKKMGGLRGGSQQQFDSAAGLAIHPFNKMIYVADSHNHRIQVLNYNLTFSHSFGGKGTQHGKFFFPWDVSFDSKGMVYVVEGNSRIQKFTPDGNFVSSFGRKGSNKGEMDRPAAITIDQHDYIHISELYNNRISMYDTSGNFVCCYGEKGTGRDGFNEPCGVVVTKNGVLYVSDCWNNRVKMFKVPNI